MYDQHLPWAAIIHGLHLLLKYSLQAKEGARRMKAKERPVSVTNRDAGAVDFLVQEKNGMK